MTEIHRRGIGLILCVIFFLVMRSGFDRFEIPDEPADSRAVWRIDLSSASSEELQLLPGIGPVLASRILTWRQQDENLNTLVDLGRIEGIGPHTIRTLQPLVSVGASSSPGEFKNED